MGPRTDVSDAARVVTVTRAATARSAEFRQLESATKRQAPPASLLRTFFTTVALSSGQVVGRLIEQDCKGRHIPAIGMGFTYSSGPAAMAL